MKKPWPWETNKIEYTKQYRETVINTILGTIFFVPFVTYLSAYFGIAQYVADIELYPSSFGIFKQVIFITIVYETWYYWTHRLLHTSWLYKHFHKKHHEYQVSVSIATIYNHPFDFVFTNIIPTYIAFWLLGEVHIITTYFWYTFITISGVLLHIGYDLPWYPWGAFPFGINIGYHDFHHSVNIGNFGVFSSVWDTICGTNKLYYKSIVKEEEKYS